MTQLCLRHVVSFISVLAPILIITDAILYVLPSAFQSIVYAYLCEQHPYQNQYLTPTMFHDAKCIRTFDIRHRLHNIASGAIHSHFGGVTGMSSSSLNRPSCDTRL
jgi:hypothetical protein